MKMRGPAGLLTLSLMSVLLTGCSSALPWPEHTAEPVAGNLQPFTSPEEVKAALVGRYAHYDVVAYEDPQDAMRTFVISYGFTDFALEGDDLIETDRFCHAGQKINQRFVTTRFGDSATQEIIPRSQKVTLQQKDGQWTLFRPATPSLIGIHGDPDQPLSFEADGDALHDADGDGKPGVTVELTIAGLFTGEIYIARREIFNYHMQLQDDGSLRGHVEDYSEQRVIDATWKILQRQSNPYQHPDYSLSPIVLVPVADEVDSCEQLMAMRDQLFPAEPAFY